MRKMLMGVLVPVMACSSPPPEDDAATGGSPAASGGSSASGGSTASTGGTTGASGGSTSASGGTTSTGGTGATGGGNMVLGHPDPSIQYPEYPGFTLYLAEEFNEPLDVVNDPIWTYSDGGLPEGRVRFVKEGISFQDGKMILTATEQPVPGSFSFAENEQVFNKPLVSGELRTRFNNFRYGRYEARFRAPSIDNNPTVNGNYISTLFVFRTPKYEDWREIDIEVTGDAPGALTTNLIYGNNETAWRPEIQDVQSVMVPGLDARTDFHTYAFEWTPESVRWFVDGQEVRVKQAGSGPGALPVPEKSAKIIMNLWIFDGSGFGGDPSNNVYPMSSEYDWVRFYKYDGDAMYPCEGPPGCLPPEDLNDSKNNPDEP